MQHYKLDEYVQEHSADDAVHLNCVANWCACTDAAGPVESLLVKFHSWRVPRLASLEWARHQI